MTLAGTHMVRILENLLPARFGGSSTDYQMVEEEDERGQTRITICVSPDVGELDEAEVIRTILDGLGEGRQGRGMMARIWSDANTLRVARKHPFMTAGGKLLPLHIRKSN